MGVKYGLSFIEECSCSSSWARGGYCTGVDALPGSWRTRRVLTRIAAGVLYDGATDMRGASVVPRIGPFCPFQVTYADYAAFGFRVINLEYAVVDMRR